MVSLSKHSKIIISGTIFIFAAISTILLVASHATTPTLAFEAESGTIGSCASKVADTTASGGNAVTFDPCQASNGTTITVATASQLTTALATAKPGDVINLADGIYSGNFTSTASGTASAPITLSGSRNAIINGGAITSGYTLSLGTKDSANTVSYWKLEGFTVTGGQKGVMVDNLQHSTIDNLYIHNTGEEGLHLRDNSSNNVVSNNTINYTGQDQEAYGEGIYVGSAYSNWKTFSQGTVDNSDYNTFDHNTISYTGAENMDIKEGTKGGIIENSSFDGHGMCYDTTVSCNYADSWIDMKGTQWQVLNNTGTYEHTVWDGGGSTNDGIQDHVISQAKAYGSGNDNTFSGNSISDVGGYGFNIQSSATGVVVSCSNTVTGAALGFANVTCTP